MASKKAFLFGCLGVGLVGVVVTCGGGIALIVYFFYSLRAEPVKAAEQFLTLVGDGKIEEAYNSADQVLRDRQSRDGFANLVKELGLTDYASASWPSWQIQNNVATLNGSVTTRSGKSIPLTMQLTQTGGIWRVNLLEVPGEPKAVEAPVVPSEEECRRLMRATLLDFDKAIKARDFTEFHAKASHALRLAKSPAELKEAFQVFVDKQVDLSGIQELTPSFDAAPALNQDQWLVLMGTYPIKPNRVRFEVKYVNEQGAWKLAALNVNVGK